MRDSQKGRERKITLKKERESKCVKQSRGSKGNTLKTSSYNERSVFVSERDNVRVFVCERERECVCLRV